MNLSLTITSELAGSPCRIELDLDVLADAPDSYSVIKATLVNLLPYASAQTRHLFTQQNPPDFTAAPDLNIRLDPDEVDILFSTEIEAAIPAAIREEEQCAEDSERESRESREMAFLESRG